MSSVATLGRTAILVCAIIAALGMGTSIFNSYNSHQYNVKQDRSYQGIVAENDALFKNKTLEIDRVNATLWTRLLNATTGTDWTAVIAQFYTYIAGNTTVALEYAKERILTINGGSGVAANVNLAAVGAGLLFESFPETHHVRLSNTGVRSLSAGPGIVFNASNGHVSVGTTCITVFEVEPPMYATSNATTIEPTAEGQTIHLMGINGINVTAAVAASALELQTAVDNLMMILEMQEMQIQNTTVQIEQLELLIETLRTLNETVVDANVTCTQLQLDVETLRWQLDTYNTTQPLNCTSTVEDVPIGTLVPWAGHHDGPFPSGHLLCDGSAFPIPMSPSDPYYELFAIIGTVYCTGPENPCGANGTLFALPNLKGRVPVGMTLAMGSVFGTMGSFQGDEQHTVSTMEMPIHTHTTNQPNDTRVRTRIPIVQNTYRGTIPQSSATLFYVGDNMIGTCHTIAPGPVITYRPWTEGSGVGGFATTGGTAGQCGCTPLDAFAKNLAFGAYVFSPFFNWFGSTTSQLGIYHPESGAPCSTLELPSEDYIHTHSNGDAGGSEAFVNVQSALVIGGYLIKAAH